MSLFKTASRWLLVCPFLLSLAGCFSSSLPPIPCTATSGCLTGQSCDGATKTCTTTVSSCKTTEIVCGGACVEAASCAQCSPAAPCTGDLTCDASGFCVAPAAAASIAAVSGSGQSGTSGSKLTSPLVVRVLDAKGNPFKGASITWAAASGGGSAAPASSTTGADGTASTQATLGAATGSQSFTAAAAGLPGSPVTFTETASAGAAAALALSSGDGQSGVAGNLLTKPLAVLVTDAKGNPVTGETVTWAATAGGGHVSATSSISGTDGVATTDATLGPVAGVNTFSASADGLSGSPVSFVETGTVGPAAKLTAVTTTGQTKVVGGALTVSVKVTDSNGNAVQGTLVGWAATAGGGQVSPTSTSSGADGSAGTLATLGPHTGVNSFKATAAGIPAVTIDVTGTAGAASKLAGVTPSGQSLLAGGTLNLQVRVTDANDNAVAGATVAWAASAGGGAVLPAQTATGADGLATTAATLGTTAGLNTFTAAASGLSGSPVSLTVTGTPGPLAKLVRISAATASTEAGAPVPLSVRATDVNDNPLPGTGVAWTVASGGGSVAPASTTAGADGSATATATLGTTAGPNVFTASAGTLSTSFSRSGTAGAAAGLRLVSGDNQSVIAGSTLALSVKVIDANSNPVAGAAVAWAATSGGGTVTPASSLSGADGVATATATFGNAVGANTFSAAAAGLTGSPVTFSGTGVVGPAKTLAIVSGDGQSALASGPLASPLVVSVTDAHGNPVSGVTVAWAVTSGGAQVSAASTATGADGKTSVTATLGAPGAATFSAAVSGLTTVAFGATGTVGAAALLERVSADNQSAPAGTTLTLTVKVSDANHNPVTGTSVAWAASSGGGSVSAASVATAAGGTSSVTATLGAVAGTNTFTATVSGLTGSPLTFTVTGQVGAAARLVKDAATDNQSAAAGTKLTLRARVTDAAGNPVPGLGVSWSKASGNGSITPSASLSAADGWATSTATLGNSAGTNTFSATFSGLAAPVVFTEAGTAGDPASLALVSGDAQSGVAGTALASLLTVQITDAVGNPVSGATVLWSVAGGGGKVSPASSQTQADGTATTTATTGTAAGPNSFAARSGALAAVTFNATGLAGSAAKLLQDTSTDGQTAVVGGAVTLRVTVTDLGGNPVQGVNVAWSTVSSSGSGASVTPTVSTSGADGKATTTATIGQSSGPNTFSAAVSGLAGSPVGFTENGTSGSAGRMVQDAATNNKSAVAGSTLLLRVTITDQGGNPVQNTTVSWSAVAGGGSVSSASSLSDASGRATSTATLGTTVGTNTFRATSAGLIGSPSDFTETGFAGAAASVAASAGSGQSGVAGALLGQPLVALVTDSHGNAVGGVTVTFSATAGGGSVSPASVITQPDGTASTFATLGTQVGANSFGAAVAGLTAAVFNATGITGAAAKLVQDGTTNGQTATAGSSVTLRVKITDSNGNPVQGTSVAWAATGGGGSVAGATSLSGADGNATISATLGTTAGTGTFTASAAGLAPATVTFTATGVAGAAVNFAKVAGTDNQSGTAGSTVTLTVLVTDANANPVTGKSVSWAAATGGGSASPASSASNASGLASTTATLGTIAGGNTFTASAASLVPPSLTFSATGVAGVPKNLLKVSADASATAGAGVTLTAKVTDAAGNPVPGVTVSWSATGGGGSITPASSTSAADGTATATATLGTAAGANTFRAAATDGSATPLTGSPLLFTQTGVAGTASKLTKTTADNLAPVAGAALGLGVKVTDANNNPVSGFTVGWATTSGGGSLAPASCATAADGTCGVTATIGKTVGSNTYTATANFSPTPATVTFTQASVAGAAATVTASAGNNQSGTAGANLAQVLTALVKDANGNAVPGATVTWAATSGGGSVTPASSTTAADGTATTSARLGVTAGANGYSATSNGISAAFSATGNAGAASVLVQDAATNNQSATVGTAVTLRVRVTDSNANGVAGFSVAWARSTGTGSVGASTSLTASDGYATIAATLGNTAGSNTFTASGTGLLPASVTFAATGTTGAPTSFTKVAATDGQSATTGTSITLTVKVTDGFGNPVVGKSIGWAAASGGGSVTPPSSNTDASGQASTSAVLGVAAGSNTFTATTASFTALTFTATGLAGTPANLVKVSVDGSPVAGTAVTLTAKVTDGSGNPVPGATVSWTRTAGAGSVAPASSVTASDGTASTTATLGALVGVNLYQASASNGATALNGSPVTFTQTGVAGVATTLTKVTADNLAPTAGGTLALRAKVTDVNTNPVAGVALAWAAATGGGSVAPASCSTAADGTCGITATLGNTVGANTFTAGGTLNGTATSVTFTQTSVAGPAANVAVSSGSGQSAVAGTALPAPLVVLVTDSHFNPVSGATVAWAAASGIISPTSSVTAANGTAGATATLPTNAGATTFTGGVSGLNTVTFGATTLPGPAVKVLLDTSTNNQTAVAGTTVTLRAGVVDTYGNAITGAALNWAAVGGGGSIAPLSGVTDNTGYMVASATLGTLAGANTFTAQNNSPTPSTVAFTVTGIAGAAKNLAKVTADNQSPTAGGTIALKAKVTDVNTNPVAGISLSWAAATGGGSVAPATCSTAADGTCSITATLGNTVGANTFTAGGTLNGTATSVTFTQTSVAGPAAKLLLDTSTNNQSAVAGTTVTLRAGVVDTYGNAITGAALNWAAASGGGSIAPFSGVTDNTGYMVATATLGTVAGANTFTAQNSSLTPTTVTFTATGTAGAAKSVARFAGDNLSQTVAQSLTFKAKVTDANGNGVAGTVLNWTTSGIGGVMGSVPATCTSIADGTCSVTATLSTVTGSQTFTATNAALTGSPLVFTATGTADAVSTLTKASTDGTSVVAGTGAAISVKATDKYGNNVPGAPISWLATAGGGSVPGSTNSNASGIATATATLGPTVGANSFSGSSPGASGSPVTFSFTGVTGPAAILSNSTTNGQYVILGGTLSLFVKVTDAFGNPVAGTSVSWGAPGGSNGSVSPASSSTNASGLATATGTVANTPGGSTNFTATVPGLTGSPVTISETQTNYFISPASVTVQAGGLSVPFSMIGYASVPLNGTSWVSPSLGSINPFSGSATTYTPPLATSSGGVVATTTLFGSYVALSSTAAITILPFNTWSTFAMPPEAPTNYTYNGAASYKIVDNVTGLTWARTAGSGLGSGYNWVNAQSACATFSPDGFVWRLPTLIELQSLVDSSHSNPAISATSACSGLCFIGSTNSAYYWTSTPYLLTAGFYWAVDFSTGASLGLASGGAAAQKNIRCVR